MNLDQWKIKNHKARNYAHFDKKISLNKVWNYIETPKNIEKHSFYPFIYYEQKFEKFDSSKAEKCKEKKRPICYSAHTDRYIFSYYGYKLNQLYNERLMKDSMDGCVIAYRDGLGKNNIHFAKQAIDFIKKSEECYIMIGDFTGFFDNLKHAYLKKMICNLLDKETLPNDYYAVFKNITSFSRCELKDLLLLNDLSDSFENISVLNEKEVVLSTKEFRNYRKSGELKIFKNKENFGIPQGSAISAVLSNIYMLDFDKLINNYVKSLNGLYLRYSDDFIVVLPKSGEKFYEQYKFIKKTVDTIDSDIKTGEEKNNGLQLQVEKTQVFEYKNNQVKGCSTLIRGDKKSDKDFINYLGFTFDGKNITIRDKTVSKYYYRMYRKAKNIKRLNWKTKTGKKISCSELYRVYSIRGAFPDKNQGAKHQGNFISYVKRAERIFGSEEKGISQVSRTHMRKIRKALK